MEEIVERCVADAQALVQARFDAAIIENFGDLPLGRGSLSPAAVAAMAVVAQEVRRQSGIRIGVNALRNDPISALGIAASCGASFIRVNVHTGVYATDQGIIEGDAETTLRFRKLLGARVAILADVNVKHAIPLGESDVVRAARDTAYRGLADGLIVTGSATGEAVDVSELRRVREAVPDRRVFVGSGATVDSIASLLVIAGGVIVGTGIKVERRTENRIDPQLAAAFAHAAGRT